MRNRIISAFLALTCPVAYASHEETCSFHAKIIEAKNAKRAPQTETSVVVAEIEILKAESAKGYLSYLDCKHWEKERIANVEIHLSTNLDTLSKDKTVHLRFSRRFSRQPSAFWRLAE